jgi:hypothetical protein
MSVWYGMNGHTARMFPRASFSQTPVRSSSTTVSSFGIGVPPKARDNVFVSSVGTLTILRDVFFAGMSAPDGSSSRHISSAYV